MDELAALREEYASDGLNEADLTPEPLAMFRRWFGQAREAGIHEPNAMVLATVSSAGVPSSRMVLLKGLDERGFGFYTNRDSRKARELAANPACSLLFPWHPLQRQVRITGRAVEMARAESAAYFASRPLSAQRGAWASRQSSVVTSRQELDARYAQVVARFGAEVPLPDFWGGYRVVPEVVEFWQGRPGRMHDRLRYRRAAQAEPDPGGHGAWIIERLAP